MKSRTIQTNVRLPAELRAAVEAAARRSNRTVSAWVVLALQKAIKQKKG